MREERLKEGGMRASKESQPAHDRLLTQPAEAAAPAGHHTLPTSTTAELRYLGNGYVQEVLRAPGQPLDPAARAFMEPRFGHDFGQVRVHADARAAESARTVNALAYTVGEDIVFDAGQYRPESEEGQQLIAHELVHVVQQRRGGDTVTPAPGGALERDAEQAGAMAVMGDGLIAISGASALGLARQPRSPAESLNPEKMTVEEIEQEIQLIKQWLKENPGASSDRALLEKNLRILNLAVANKLLIGYQRRYGEAITELTSDKLEAAYHAASLSTGIVQGFLVGSQQTIGADAWAALSDELGQPMNNLAFQIGTQLGMPVGALKSLRDNIVGLVEMAGFASSTYMRYFTVEGISQQIAEQIIEIVIDQEGYLARKRAKVQYVRQILEGLQQFINSFLTNPSFLLEQGYELGQVIGYSTGEWYETEFARDTPFKKGMTVGKAAGYLTMEIALMFVGPEEWALRGLSAAGKAIRGSRAARAVFEALEHIPGLRRIMQARRGVGEVVQSEKIASETAEAGAKAADELAGGAARTQEASTPARVTSEPTPAPAEPAPSRPEPTLAEPTPAPAEPTPATPEPQSAQRGGAEPDLDEEFDRSFAQTFTEPTPPVRPPQTGPVSPERVAGFTAAQIQRLPELLAKPLTHGDIAILSQLWQRTARADDVATLTLSNSRRLFDNHRRRFWRAVANDPQARALFTNAGLSFERGGTAPFLTLPSGRRIRLTIDHIIERQLAPGRALDPTNLRLVFERENTVLLRLLHQLDPFQ